MTCHPSEGNFHFLGVDDVKVFSSCHFFCVQVADVPFDFVNQILGPWGSLPSRVFIVAWLLMLKLMQVHGLLIDWVR